MNIRELRKETKLSQQEFAKAFSIPVRTIQEWEQGRRTPADYIIKMLKYIILQNKIEDFYIFTHQ